MHPAKTTQTDSTTRKPICSSSTCTHAQDAAGYTSSSHQQLRQPGQLRRVYQNALEIVWIKCVGLPRMSLMQPGMPLPCTWCHYAQPPPIGKGLARPVCLRHSAVCNYGKGGGCYTSTRSQPCSQPCRHAHNYAWQTASMRCALCTIPVHLPFSP